MTYSELTDQQKADIATADRYYRQLNVKLMRLFRDSDPLSMSQWIADNVDPLVASLADAESIPNATDYAGAKDLTKADFVAMQQLGRDLKTLALTNLALLTKICGVNAG